MRFAVSDDERQRAAPLGVRSYGGVCGSWSSADVLETSGTFAVLDDPLGNLLRRRRLEVRDGRVADGRLQMLGLPTSRRVPVMR